MEYCPYIKCDDEHKETDVILLTFSGSGYYIH